MLKELDAIDLGASTIQQIVPLQQLPVPGCPVVCPSHQHQASDQGTIGIVLPGLKH